MRVLLADGHPKVRWALRTFIQEETGFTVVGEAADSDTLFSQAQLLQPDLILLDWELIRILADTSLLALCALTPNVQVIVLSSREDSEQEALDAGASGFVSKATGPEKLLTMLRQLAETGERPSSTNPTYATRLAERESGIKAANPRDRSIH